MTLAELKTKTPTELTDLARSFNVSSEGNLSKQQLIFKILSAQCDRGIILAERKVDINNTWLRSDEDYSPEHSNEDYPPGPEDIGLPDDVLKTHLLKTGDTVWVTAGPWLLEPEAVNFEPPEDHSELSIVQLNNKGIVELNKVAQSRGMVDLQGLDKRGLVYKILEAQVTSEDHGMVQCWWEENDDGDLSARIRDNHSPAPIEVYLTDEELKDCSLEEHDILWINVFMTIDEVEVVNFQAPFKEVIEEPDEEIEGAVEEIEESEEDPLEGKADLSISDLKQLSIAELAKIAGSLNLSDVQRLGKEDLIYKILEQQSALTGSRYTRGLLTINKYGAKIHCSEKIGSISEVHISSYLIEHLHLKAGDTVWGKCGYLASKVEAVNFQQPNVPKQKDAELTITDLKEQTIPELTKLARRWHVGDVKGLDKQDLIYRILETQSADAGYYYVRGTIEIESKNNCTLQCSESSNQVSDVELHYDYVEKFALRNGDTVWGRIRYCLYEVVAVNFELPTEILYQRSADALTAVKLEKDSIDTLKEIARSIESVPHLVNILGGADYKQNSKERLVFDILAAQSNVDYLHFAEGKLEILLDGSGLLRLTRITEKVLDFNENIYVSPFLIRSHALRTGSLVWGRVSVSKRSSRLINVEAVDFGIRRAGESAPPSTIRSAVESLGEPTRRRAETLPRDFVQGRLDVLSGGSGFLRSATHSYSSGAGDVYVPAHEIRRWNLRTGEVVRGEARAPKRDESFFVLVAVKSVDRSSPQSQMEDISSPQSNLDEQIQLSERSHIEAEIEGIALPSSRPSEDEQPSRNADNLPPIAPTLIDADQSSSSSSQVAPVETQDGTNLSATDSRAQGSSDPLMEQRGDHGPCTECVYFRNGHSVVRPAFDAVLGSLKSQLQMAYTQKLHEERQSSDLAFVELESNIQQERIDYTRRPMVPQIRYCGLDEFEGMFYLCEVKNLDDEGCDDFTRKDSDWNTHSCRTCMWHRQPDASLVQVIENITGSRPKGQPIRDQIRQSLQNQAETEFDACIEGTGILPVDPGLLPICGMYSSPSSDAGPRFVVGPVANAGEACRRWSFGKDVAGQDLNNDLVTLVVRAQDAVKERISPSVMNDNILASTDRRQATAANAQADVIEYCLNALKVNPEFVESMCRQFTLDVWFSERKKGNWREEASSSRASAAQSPQGTNVTPGNQTAQGFPITINTTYRHPRVEDLHFVIYQYPPYFTAQVNYIQEGKQDLFDLSQFQPGTWIQLTGRRGPIPIALGITGPPLHQFYGMWL